MAKRGGYSLDIDLPDIPFTLIAEEVMSEVERRVVQRTPRSSLNKAHLQDQWHREGRGTDKQNLKNDFDYAGYVEYGTSKMAGAHMVSTTLEEVPDIVQAALRKYVR